ATGLYVTFDGQLPELENLTAISKTGTTTTFPTPTSPVVKTVSQAAQVPVVLTPGGTGEYLLEIDNVTLSGFGATTFGSASLPVGSTAQAFATDASGATVAVFYSPGTYGTAYQNLNGQTIPTGPVNVQGIVSIFNS